jgi:hypothetical protein
MRQFARTNWVFVWLTVLSAALGYVALGEAAAERRVTDFDEINVHRINIIEPDGKPRVIIANRARMAGLYWGGKEYQHPTRDSAGFLFFNDDGDEVGGMTFSNRRKGNDYGASSGLLFDQYKQDQTLGLMYDEENGKRQAGLRVWDRPDQSMQPAIELSDALAKAKTEQERASVHARLDALVKSWGPHPVAERFFAGKTLDDKQGRARLVLKVDGAGNASIEVLDESGAVTRHFP